MALSSMLRLGVAALVLACLVYSQPLGNGSTLVATLLSQGNEAAAAAAHAVAAATGTLLLL